MSDPAHIAPALPLLSLLLLTLPLGALLIWLVPDAQKARRIALGVSLLDLFLGLAAVARFDPNESGFQLVERHDWIPTLNIQYMVGVDGISVLCLLLTALLFAGVLLAPWTGVRTMQRLYYSLLLLLQSMTLGIFCALDMVLFFLFWELSLIPIYFLVSLWGIGPDRRFAAVKYALFMLVGECLCCSPFWCWPSVTQAFPVPASRPGWPSTIRHCSIHRCLDGSR